MIKVPLSPLHSANASSPMFVTEFGMVILVSPLQLKKAPYSMEVTELGIVMLVSLL